MKITHIHLIPALAVIFLGCATARTADQKADTAPVAAKAPEAEPEKPAASKLTVDSLLDKMESVRKTVKTYTADVTKTVETPALNEKEKYVGALKFKAPRLLRMELTNEENKQETLYVVGKEYGWIYRKYKKQVERGKLSDADSKAEKGNPLQYGLAKDIHGLREGYTLSLLPEETVAGRKTIPLQLKPEGGTSYSKGRIIFWIDLETWMPVQLREYKSNDETVETHTFTNIKLNSRISDSTFNFEPPKDVDFVSLDSVQ